MFPKVAFRDRGEKTQLIEQGAVASRTTALGQFCIRSRGLISNFVSETEKCHRTDGKSGQAGPHWPVGAPCREDGARRQNLPYHTKTCC